MGTSGRLVVLISAVSALLPLSAWLLVNGADSGELPIIAAGALLAAAGLFGLLALIRVVIVIERRKLGQ